MNVKTAVSPDGGFSGTSGKQKPTHVCISASENCPFRRSVLAGRVSSNLCVLMCNESGLIWYLWTCVVGTERIWNKRNMLPNVIVKAT